MLFYAHFERKCLLVMQAAILFLLLVVICLQIFIILVIKQSSGNASEDSGNAAAPTQEQQKELLFHIQQNLSALSQSLKESSSKLLPIKIRALPRSARTLLLRCSRWNSVCVPLN